MATIKIQGKEYPLPDNFTFREARKIKSETGLTVGGMTRAYAEGDADVTFALTMIALDRAGETGVDPNSVPLGDVQVDFEDEPGADLPKAQAPDIDAGENDAPNSRDGATT